MYTCLNTKKRTKSQTLKRQVQRWLADGFSSSWFWIFLIVLWQEAAGVGAGLAAPRYWFTRLGRVSEVARAGQAAGVWQRPRRDADTRKRE